MFSKFYVTPLNNENSVQDSIKKHKPCFMEVTFYYTSLYYINGFIVTNLKVNKSDKCLIVLCSCAATTGIMLPLLTFNFLNTSILWRICINVVFLPTKE